MRDALRPLHAELDDDHGAEREQFKSWLGDAEWVESNPESLSWARENAVDIQKKREVYFAEWMQKSPAERPMLVPEDGL